MILKILFTIMLVEPQHKPEIFNVFAVVPAESAIVVTKMNTDSNEVQILKVDKSEKILYKGKSVDLDFVYHKMLDREQLILHLENGKLELSISPKG